MKAKLFYVAMALVMAVALVTGFVAAPAPAISGLSPVDSVDFGNTTSEAGHSLKSWGPIEPATSGGNWGGSDHCRPQPAEH